MRHRNLLFSALGDLIRRRLRSLVATFCLAAVLFPFLTALAISEGLRFQAEIGVREGADLFVSGYMYGGEGVIPMSYVEKLKAVSGIDRVTARVVGRTFFVDRLVAVVGLDPGALARLKPLVRGNIPSGKGEVLIGQGIAEAFGVRKGMRFTLAANNRKTFRATGTLDPSCLWGSDIMIMAHGDANEFFRMRNCATQVLLEAGPGSASASGQSKGELKRQLVRSFPRLWIKERAEIGALLISAYNHQGGIFVVLFVIGVALSISAFLVASGLGLRELDKEIAVLKAVGWRTREILEKIVWENLMISLAAVSLSLLASMMWIKGFNGILIGQFYIAEVGLVPQVDIPSRYLPSHGLVGLGFSLCVTLLGGMFSAWKKASMPPHELMR